MKLQFTALAALATLAACGDDATPAQEQRAEQLEERADAVEQAGDQAAAAIDEVTDARAEALNERADALEDGEIPVGQAVRPVPPAGADMNARNQPGVGRATPAATLPPATTGAPPANAAGAGENG
ncbi:hypothetical protein ABVV53_11885 [Novosphingobium sp. RD2P27]|uniref:Uncharacterized protein n=1 Tax=Novosphingobium kalidii TaxID=3230299 RepID=A0ABV2D2X7_9SPHN